MKMSRLLHPRRDLIEQRDHEAKQRKSLARELEEAKDKAVIDQWKRAKQAEADLAQANERLAEVAGVEAELRQMAGDYKPGDTRLSRAAAFRYAADKLRAAFSESKSQ